MEMMPMNKLAQLRKSRSIDEPLTFLPWNSDDDTSSSISHLNLDEGSHDRSSLISFNSFLEYYNSPPITIPSITLSSSYIPPSTPPDQPIFTPSAGQKIMPSASSLPKRINYLYSRLKSKSLNSSPEPTPNSFISHPSLNSSIKHLPPEPNSSTLPRPSPVKVPPSSVGLDVDPRSWVQSDDSEEESDDETLVKNATAPTSLGDDDEVPLSRLRIQASPTNFDSPASETHFRSKAFPFHRSSYSLHSLSKKPEPPTAPPQPPSLLLPQNAPDHGAHIPSCYVFPRMAQPLMPIRPLRPAMSSPNLCRERLHSQPTHFNLASFPVPPLPHSQPSSVGFNSSRFTPNRGHHKFPSQNSQLGTPPSSISPSARSYKLSSPQSSVSFRSADKEVYRRMKQRHKEDLNHLHPKNSGSPPFVNIDPSLYSMLSDAQRMALRQRSDILTQNLKMHLESYAYEMIQSNIRQQCFNAI